MPLLPCPPRHLKVRPMACCFPCYFQEVPHLDDEDMQKSPVAPSVMGKDKDNVFVAVSPPALPSNCFANMLSSPPAHLQEEPMGFTPSMPRPPSGLCHTRITVVSFDVPIPEMTITYRHAWSVASGSINLSRFVRNHAICSQHLKIAGGEANERRHYYNGSKNLGT